MTEPNETVQSQLSAFVDNELPQDETELLARRLSRDAELQQSLSRYLLIGEALRVPSQARVSRNFSERVAAAIEQQVASVDKQQGEGSMPSRQRKWLKPAAGMALAASVAAGVVMSMHSLQFMPATGASQLAAGNTKSNSVSSTSPNSYVVPVATTTPSVPISATRLTNYVVAHSEFTSPLGRRNTMTGLVTSDQQIEVEDDNADTKDAAK